MTATGFLTSLQRLGVEVSAAGNRLRYRAPEGTVTPALREQMARYKEEILALLHEPEAKPSAPEPTEANTYPLSPAQERLWFMDHLVPNTALYNEAIALRLSGDLCVPALLKALNDLVRRHEALRTSFEAIEGEPYQRISPSAQLNIPLVDLSLLPEKIRNDQAHKLAIEQAEKPFKLIESPLIRAGLTCLCPKEHVLVICLHHIICDGWSRAILVRELGRLYDSFHRNERSLLPEPDLQYSDFALWQKERIDMGYLDHEMEYWREHLGTSPPVMNLPTGWVRPQLQSFRGANLEIELSREVSEGVRKLSRANGVTPFMTLMAAWQVVLGRYCAQDELIVGTVVANRARAEAENIIGLMVNTLAIKGDLTGNPTFREMLGRVRDAAVGAYKHQELPYEKLVAELITGRDPGRSPLVEVMFVIEEGLIGQVELDGLTVREEKIDLGTAKYDLMLMLKEKLGGFQGWINYSTDLFDAPKIKRMAESFCMLVEAAIAEPDRQIYDLPLLSEPERRKLLIEWNDTAVEYASHKNVHQMFEQQRERTPDAVAAVYDDESLTYRELNYKSNQLAHYLRGLGVGPGMLVGLCLERSLEMAVGVLAILKSGAAYLPLDSAYPENQLRFMLEDARTPVLLTQEHLRERLPEHSAKVICLNSEWELIKGQRRENPVDVATVDDLAYVIYTSGSTGRPKGVCLPHGALTNLIKWHTSKAIPKVRMLQFASLSFDVSFYEMFATWEVGGTVFIVSEEFRLDIPRLASFLSDNLIEKAILPVVVLQQLAEEHGFRKQQFESLKEVITTGEQLQITRPIVKLFEDFRQCSLNNHYGPSESHVITSHSLSGEPDSWSSHPPIGKPIANAQIYLLDQHLNPVPTGTIGELHIGGVGMARGYLNRPDLTAERFIPNHFSQRPGGRMYKTGDLVRHLEDGSIEVLGRADHQVKIRGFRVELGEVESVLDQHAAVREAIVVTREDLSGNKRLFAYVAADRKHKLRAEELSAYLKERLPDHMVPSGFVVMEKLPLTPNGKVDRSALMVNFQPVVQETEDLIPACTPAEELVAKIWSEVLCVENVGVNSNFFNLGGHSMLASKIIMQLREIFRIELPVRSLFEFPTVGGIVKAMSDIWGGREIVEEIAWTFIQVEETSEEDVSRFLAQNSFR